MYKFALKKDVKKKKVNKKTKTKLILFDYTKNLIAGAAITEEIIASIKDLILNCRLLQSTSIFHPYSF